MSRKPLTNAQFAPFVSTILIAFPIQVSFVQTYSCENCFITLTVFSIFRVRALIIPILYYLSSAILTKWVANSLAKSIYVLCVCFNCNRLTIWWYHLKLRESGVERDRKREWKDHSKASFGLSKTNLIILAKRYFCERVCACARRHSSEETAPTKMWKTNI